jgi:hypothetical protein
MNRRETGATDGTGHDSRRAKNWPQWVTFFRERSNHHAASHLDAARSAPPTHHREETPL